MGTTLIVKGTLRGMGCEVECALIASRSESLGASSPTFTKCAILEAPLWLPDGYYEATFCGQSAFLHRVNGTWSVGIPWPQVPARRFAQAETDAVMMHPAACPAPRISK